MKLRSPSVFVENGLFEVLKEKYGFHIHEIENKLFLINSKLLLSIYGFIHESHFQIDIVDIANQSISNTSRFEGSSPQMDKIEKLYEEILENHTESFYNDGDQNSIEAEVDLMSSIKGIPLYLEECLVKGYDSNPENFDKLKDDHWNKFEDIIKKLNRPAGSDTSIEFTRKRFYLFENDANSKVTGVEDNQIERLHNDNDIDYEGYQLYNKASNKFIPDSLDLKNFRLKIDANRTGFISSRLLRFQGFFILPEVATILNGFILSNAKILDAVAYQNMEPLALKFLNILPTDAIDYQKSQFVVKTFFPTESEAIRSLEIKDQEDLINQSIELINENSLYGVHPTELFFNKKVDFCKLPTGNNYYISADLLEALNEKNIDGFIVNKVSFSSFIS